MNPRPSLSCALPPGRGVAEQAAHAERLGYERVWLFDSPAMFTDVWAAMVRVAEATSTIGLGTGVAVPSLRHPMVTASAVLAVEDIAPGRLSVGFGTGFTARYAMGQRPLDWATMRRYVEQVRALLAGKVVEIDGSAAQLVYAPGFGPSLPVEVPIWLAVSGPKGFDAARSLGVDGILVMAPPRDQPSWRQCGLLRSGTVLRPGETASSPRVVDAAGLAYALNYHAVWEVARPALANMPGGAEWLEAIERERPEGERHLAVHEGHLHVLTKRDRILVERAGDAILAAGWNGTPSEIAARYEEAGRAGITEVLHIVTGPDIGAELEAFATVARHGT